MQDRLDTLRSLLFAPASDLSKAAKAFASSADAVILDLEDAVLPNHKSAARADAMRFRQPSPGALLMVRVNAVGTEWFADDMSAVGESEADAIVLPKADAKAVEHLAEDGIPVLALIETATGLRDVWTVAEHPRVFCLFLGGVDLAADLGLEPRSDGLELLHARSSLVVASAAANLRPPVDVVQVDFRNDAVLTRECGMARSLGFGAKACIHPAQVEIVNREFSPSPEECSAALAIVEAFDRAQASGSGLIVVDGKMVDLPVVRRARGVLRRAHADARTP